MYRSGGMKLKRREDKRADVCGDIDDGGRSRGWGRRAGVRCGSVGMWSLNNLGFLCILGV
jgi:hypothetical protein